MIHKGPGKCSQTDECEVVASVWHCVLLCVNSRRGSRSATLDGNVHALFGSAGTKQGVKHYLILCLKPASFALCTIVEFSVVQIITRKELNKRMISSAGTRKLYMMQLGDNT